MAVSVRDCEAVARRIHALGLGIAAWLHLEFSVHELGPAKPSSSIVVAAVDALGVALELLAIDG